MKRLLRPLAIVVIVGIAAFALASISGDNTNNNEANNGSDGSQAEEQQTNENGSDETPEEQPATPYSYTAQAGDSYTKMARKAVQAYGDNNDTELSPAEIIAAETFLTSDAGFPQLNLGERVELNADTIKAAVEKARGLSDAAKALWEKYVPNVNFDTSGVGEARG